MKRFVQILYDKAHWIFTAEENPDFSPDIIILDITDSKYDYIREGWDYHKENDSFTEPIPITIPTPQPSDIDILKEKLTDVELQSSILDLKVALLMEEVNV